MKINTYSSSKKKTESSSSGKRLTFSLEVSFIVRLLDKELDQITGRLLRFDSHQRDKKLGGIKSKG